MKVGVGLIDFTIGNHRRRLEGDSATEELHARGTPILARLAIGRAGMPYDQGNDLNGRHLGKSIRRGHIE